VALSDVCNETIVDRSVQLLQAKNRRGTERHQIIDAHCSIRSLDVYKTFEGEPNGREKETITQKT
jgi:hypothetical protein